MSGIIRDVTIGGCRLIQGDCLEVMPTLGPVDAVVTDPPYEAHMHAAKRGRKVYEAGKRSSRKIRIDGHANPPPVNFASIDGIRCATALEIVKLSGGWALVFCTPEGVAAWRDSLEIAGAKYKRACVWVKPDSAPQFNGQGPAMGAEMFCAAWCGSGHARWNGGGRRNVWTYLCQPPDRTGLHPTEKPVGLIADMIRLFSDGGQTILDPFMGSGTTLVACAKLGRRGIGIELDPDYFDIACKRVEEAYRQPDLFIEPPAKPVQEGFDL